MQDTDIIKAMDAYAAESGLLVTTIGQMAVANRNAYERLKKGTAHRKTGERILAWITKDRKTRKLSKQQGDAA